MKRTDVEADEVTVGYLPKSKVVQSVLGGREPVNAQATASGAVTLDLKNGNVFDLTLVGNVTGVTVLNAGAAGLQSTFTVIVRQDATGGRFISAWMAGIKWAAGTAPTLTSTPSAVDVLTFLTVNGGTNWLGFVAGLDVR